MPMCQSFVSRLLDLRNGFIAANQNVLLASLEVRDRMRGPIVLPQIF